MSNAKIRHWIYVAIGFLILCGIGFFLLLRESKYSDASAPELFAAHESEYQEVVTYLRKKEIYTDVKAVPTIDNRYGIIPEDTEEYRAFYDAISRLMLEDVSEIVSTEECIQFRSPKSGGFLNQSYITFVYGDAPPMIGDAPRSEMAQKNWYYFLGKE